MDTEQASAPQGWCGRLGTCQHVSPSVNCQMATWTPGTFRSHWSSASWDEGLGPSMAAHPGLTLASVSSGPKLVVLEQCLWEDSKATTYGLLGQN